MSRITKRNSTRCLALILALGLIGPLTGASADIKIPAPDHGQEAAFGGRALQRTPAILSGGTLTGTEEGASGNDGAPESTENASSPNNYVFATSTGTYTPLSTGGGATQVGAVQADEAISGLIPLGFDFWFMGVRYTQVRVSSNGFISFNALATATFANSLSASAANVRPLIAPLWDDLHGGGGLAFHQTTGSVGSRVFTFEWRNWRWDWNVGTPVISFQCKLHEGTGSIEYIYRQEPTAVGTGSAGASIGFAATATGSGNYLSISSTGPNNGQPAPTASSTAETSTLTVKPATGQVYTFTPPPAPAAPSGLNFTGVTQTAMTLNWTDNATTEAGYGILRSLDGVNYSYVTTTAPDATSHTATGLIPGTTYFWQVYAVTEGAPSAPASGSQATDPAGVVSCAGAGGPWSDTATWSGAALPVSTDNVTINDGCTVTIDTTATVNRLTVGEGSSGILQYESAVARTLTVVTNVVVSSGGTFRSNPAGTVTTHSLSVGGNLTNGGLLDFSTNGNTAGAQITFTGADDALFTLSGLSTTNLRQTTGVTLNKGTNFLPVLTFTPGGTLTVQGANTAGFLSISNGTFRIAGTSTHSNPVFNSASYTIPASGGFHVDNPNITVAGLGGSPTLNGLLRMSQGTYNIGTASGNSLGFGAGSTINVEGGAINAAGRFGVATAGNNISYEQSGGTVTVCTLGNTSTTLASFDLGTSGASTVRFSGGSVVIQLAGTGGSGPRDYRNGTIGSDITGGTLRLGNASSGTAKTFFITGTSGSSGDVPNLVIDNTSGNHSATILATSGFALNTTINPGTTLNLNNFTYLQIGPTFTNNGTLNGTPTSSRLYFLGSTTPQTYEGSGTVTAVLGGMSIDNPAGVTIASAVANNIIAARVNLFKGTLTNANKVTLGNGGTTAATTQIGVGGGVTPGGFYDVSPTFNVGTGGYNVLYLQESVPRTTGVEIPASRSIATTTISNTNHVTLAGGDLTLTGASALTLTAGRFNTSAANVLRLASTVTTIPSGSTASYVNGPLAIEVNSAANVSRTFAVGNLTGWRPVVLGSFHSGGVLRTYTTEVLTGPTGGTPVPPLVELTAARYVRLQNTANVFSTTTATVQLSYGPDDNVGNLPTARVSQSATAAGSYVSRGGATAASPTTGIVSTTAISMGDEFFVLANEQPLPTPPTNDGCAGAIPLSLDTPVSGSTILGADDFVTVAGCFTGIGQTVTTAPGRDVVYSFTAPSADSYSFRVTNYDVAQNLVLSIGASPCSSGCTVAANRTVSPSSPSNSNTSEEVPCQALASGQTVFVYVDDAASGNGGSNFRIEVNRCVAESEPNGTPAQANALSCGVEGAISPAADADFFSIGSPATGTRVFAMTDGVAMNTNDLRLRVTTSADTLEFDDDDNDASFGQFSPNISGARLTGTGSFVRVDHFSATAVSEPYRLYTVLQPDQPAAAVESEPNGTAAQANADPISYFYGSAAGSSADTDFFSFTAGAGDLVVIGLDGDPLRNNTPINASLALIGTDGTTILASVNDANSSSSTTPGTGSLTATTPNSPGEALTFRITASGTYYARVVNTSAAAGDYLLSISKNCAASTDLAVTKIGTPDPVIASQNITYTITVTNNGPNAAVTPTLSDSTPANTTFVSLNAPGGWSCSTPSVGGTGAISCSASSLPSGDSAVFTLVVKVDNCVGAIVVSNTASVSNGAGDWNDANDSATELTNVTPLNCNDGNDCTADSCNPLTGCVNDPVPDGSACSDSDVCTQTDTCQSGACVGSNPVVCTPLSDCHVAGVCHPVTGCSNPPAASGTSCDDSSVCTTVDECDGAGNCVGGSPLNCNDSNACTSDSCDSVTGCANTPISCDDASVCTTDSCDSVTGCANTPISCDDSDACTTDTCDDVTGCDNTPISCDDLNPCTIDSCDSVTGCVNTGYTPPLVTNVQATSLTVFQWNSAGGGILYDVLRGALGEFPVGTGFSEICHDPLTPLTMTTDTAVPGANAGFYYLVRTDDGGCKGSYGNASNSNPRISSACP